MALYSFSSYFYVYNLLPLPFTFHSFPFSLLILFISVFLYFSLSFIPSIFRPLAYFCLFLYSSALPSFFSFLSSGQLSIHPSQRPSLLLILSCFHLSQHSSKPFQACGPSLLPFLYPIKLPSVLMNPQPFFLFSDCCLIFVHFPFTLSHILSVLSLIFSTLSSFLSSLLLPPHFFLPFLLSFFSIFLCSCYSSLLSLFPFPLLSFFTFLTLSLSVTFPFLPLLFSKSPSILLSIHPSLSFFFLSSSYSLCSSSLPQSGVPQRWFSCSLSVT